MFCVLYLSEESSDITDKNKASQIRAQNKFHQIKWDYLIQERWAQFLQDFNDFDSWQCSDIANMKNQVDESSVQVQKIIYTLYS